MKACARIQLSPHTPVTQHSGMWLYAFLLSIFIKTFCSADAAGFVRPLLLQRGTSYLLKLGYSQEIADVTASRANLPLGSTRVSEQFSRTGGAQRFTGLPAWAFQACLTTASSQQQRTAGAGLITPGENPVARACYFNRGSRCWLLAPESGGRGAASESLLSSQGTALPTPEDCSQSPRSTALWPPRGFRDFPPSTFAVHKHIFSVWREVAEELGFQEYKGPSVESSSLFSHFGRHAPTHANPSRAASLPPHIYRLEGSEGLCLRPELTPSLVRMLQREELHRPSSFARRWFCIERVWRHERPGLGRRREHFQLNMDIAFPSRLQQAREVASPVSSFQVKGRKRQQGQPLNENACGLEEFRVLAVAELIAAAARIFQRLGLKSADVRIRVGSRALLCDLLSLLGFEASSDNKDDACMQASFATPLAGAAAAGFAAFEASSAGRMGRALRVLDRASKRSRAETEEALGEALGISCEASSRLFERIRSFDISDDAAVQQVAACSRFLSGSRPSSKTEVAKDASSPHAILASVKEMRMLLWLLQEVYGVRDWVDVDLSIVRGLHYYTGIVFEAFDAENAFRAILGGGCYGERLSSSTCTQATRGFQGVGLGMGDCVLFELLQRKRLLPANKAILDVVVILRQPKRVRRLCNDVESRAVKEEGTHVNQQTWDADRSSSHTFLPLPQVAEAQALCRKLRAKGLKVELLLPPQSSVRASLRHAQSLGAKGVVFVAALPGTECNRDIRSAAGELVEKSEAFISPEENRVADERERRTRIQFQVLLRQSGPKGLLQGTEVIGEDQVLFKSANANSSSGLDAGKPPREALFRMLKVFRTASRAAAFLKGHFNQF
ncbi:hypothetical protein Esti_000683 [Eimeria stiedai]